MHMIRLGSLLCVALLGGGAVAAATLEQLSLDDMVLRSTAIVRARAGESRSVREGALIYTFVQVEVLDQWKGEVASRLEVALPGGQVDGLSQHFGGVPTLKPGQEFVGFLWTGRTGRTHLLGLSQGYFDVLRDDKGKITVHRKPTADLMLAADSATPVAYISLEMPLEVLVAKIHAVTGAGGPSPK
jgi:hypothetical protein